MNFLCKVNKEDYKPGLAPASVTLVSSSKDAAAKKYWKKYCKKENLLKESLYARVFVKGLVRSESTWPFTKIIIPFIPFPTISKDVSGRIKRYRMSHEIFQLDPQQNFSIERPRLWYSPGFDFEKGLIVTTPQLHQIHQGLESIKSDQYFRYIESPNDYYCDDDEVPFLFFKGNRPYSYICPADAKTPVFLEVEPKFLVPAIDWNIIRLS